MYFVVWFLSPLFGLGGSSAHHPWIRVSNDQINDNDRSIGPNSKSSHIKLVSISLFRIVVVSFSFLPDFLVVRNVNKQVWVFLGSSVIVGAAAYPVFFSGRDEKLGHDLFSSDKPEAIRESQEAERRQYRKKIKEYRARLAKDQADAAEAEAATGGSSSS